MYRRFNIQKRLALVLWGSVLFAFIVAGGGLAVYQSLTQEDRALRIMEPYARLVSVGTDAAVAFEDPHRAQEILDTLGSNPEIQEVVIYLKDGRVLASFNRKTGTEPSSLPVKPLGIYLEEDRVELFESLPNDAYLLVVMGLTRLNEQTQQLLTVFGAGVLILLSATLGQLAILRHMIVRPIATLTQAAEHVRTRADYSYRVATVGEDEVARLGMSFNAMLETVQESQGLLLKAQQIAHLGNWRHDLLTGKIFWSDEIFRILGCRPYPPTDEVGLSWVHPEDRPLLQDALKASLEAQDAFSWEFRIVRTDGAVRWVNLRREKILDGQGREIARIGTYQDITQRKSTEEKLQRLNRELRAISECNQILVRAEDERSLVESICRTICTEAGYLMAWVGYSEMDEVGRVNPFAWFGNESRYLELLPVCRPEEERPGDGPIDTVLKHGVTAGIDDFETDPRAEGWRDAALERGYRSCLVMPLKDETGVVFGVLCIYADAPHAFSDEDRHMLAELGEDLAFGITTLRAREQHARAEEQIRIAATAFEAQEGILITDVDQRILRVNGAFSEITGYTAQEVIGATPRLLKSSRHDRLFFVDMWKAIAREGVWQGEIWNRRKNEEEFLAWLNITAVTCGQGEVTHYVGTMTDITERKEAQRQIEHLAFYDLLTDLPNRRLLMDRLHQAMIGSSRSHHLGALLFIDLDNFKILNDTRGHDIGDLLLVEVARRLGRCVREGDTISRLGGDEFVVMLEGLHDLPAEAAAQAKLVGEKVLEHLSEPYLLADHVHHSTSSIGITLFSGNEGGVEDMLKHADIAMYQAKTAGRNTLRFFDPEMQASLAARALIESALHVGIQQQQFVLYYQAQNHAQRGIIGAEALLRWRNPQHGLVLPDEFIFLAEESGLILSIGQWVLEHACRQLARWAEVPRLRELDLAVNVSEFQFRQKGFVSQVAQTLKRTGAPAGRLKLELTESLVIENIQYAIAKMRELKALGVGFAMDDFGTGYSSLSYLTRLPLNAIKIDRSFILNLPDNPNDAVVVQTLINLADSLGLKIIAEGVETQAQKSFLQEHGCPVFQGYLFSSPMEIEQFEALVLSS
jgi:diguanylate cyclase (GGDEF)-like protein/PAS domain S-box-containing protein